MMKKKRDVFNVQLDKDEQELLESVERGEWKTVQTFIASVLHEYANGHFEEII